MAASMDSCIDTMRGVIGCFSSTTSGLPWASCCRTTSWNRGHRNSLRMNLGKEGERRRGSPQGMQGKRIGGQGRAPGQMKGQKQRR
jgi:hypothetical protein